MSDATNSDIRKKRGRPAIGSTPIMVKLPPDQLSKLDQWIADQGEAITRPEAIRRIVASAL